MLEETQFLRIAQSLPLLQLATPALLEEFKQATFFARIPAGRDVFLEGDRVEAIALLVSGVVRVYKVGETGREITLYRFGNGSSQRLSKVMEVIEEVVFHRMDRRVAALLLRQAKMKNPLRITHQEIASELGSSREVISRLLEDFVSEGSIHAGRGMVEVLDFEQLEARSLM